MSRAEKIEKIEKALKQWYKESAQSWWQRTGKAEAICDFCTEKVTPDSSYLIGGSYLECEKCTDNLINPPNNPTDWDEALKNLDLTFGPNVPEHIKQLAKE